MAQTVLQDVRKHLLVAEMMSSCAGQGRDCLAPSLPRAAPVWGRVFGEDAEAVQSPLPAVIPRNKGPGSARLCSLQEDQVMSE